MASNKLTRELETRELTERPKQWMPAELLPEPDKQAGYAYRWIRVSNLNTADPRNLSSKLREGWQPVMLEEQPEIQTVSSIPIVAIRTTLRLAGYYSAKLLKSLLVNGMLTFKIRLMLRRKLWIII